MVLIQLKLFFNTEVNSYRDAFFQQMSHFWQIEKEVAIDLLSNGHDFIPFYLYICASLNSHSQNNV